MKVLIISHNPMNLDENNGRTIRNLFSTFSNGEIAQLYLHTGKTEAPFCNDYYCITDFDIINSIVKFKKPGQKVNPKDNKDNFRKDEKTYGKYSHKTTYVRFMRDFAWGLGTWKTNSLKKWLNAFDPDVIFFYASDSVFSHRIAKWVKLYLDKPMIIYWVDDFYIKLKGSNNIIEKINQKLFKAIAKENIKNAHNLCITSAMAKDYESLFNQEFGVLLNTSTNEPFTDKSPGKPIKLTYLGNISCGRYNSIITIGRIIDEYHLPIDFRVYSGEYRPEILEIIRNNPGFSFHGRVSYNEVKKLMEETDLLLHVEDFQKEYIDYCRYSLSTKIADSLMSNRCLLCYGPKEVASINYLLQEECSIVACDQDELKEKLMWICDNTDSLSSIAHRAMIVARKNHSVINNSTKIRQLVQRAIENDNR